ncbi:MAG: 4Fe-4S dicluster domain-containing protein [Candidatus Thorarchaeota archaeon]
MFVISEFNESQEIKEIQESAQPCFQCGICASSCPVFRVAPEFNPRLAVDKIIQSGSVGSDGKEWFCAQCLKCDQRCPMGVSLAHILLRIKGISSRHGDAPRSVQEIMDSIQSSGIVGQTSGRAEKKRKELGLPDLPRPEIEEIQTILNETSATRILSQYYEEEGSD